jgi:hypothetical protein
MGIRLGIGKKEKVIIKAIRGRIESSIIITHKSCILKKCISTDGNIVPLLLVLKGKIY